MTSPDALVIGGGVVGLFCAYHLRRHGLSVTVVERGAIGGPQSCSSGNTGFLGTHAAPVPSLLELKRESLGLYRELCGSGPLAGTYSEPGMIMAYRTAAELEQAGRALPGLVARGLPMWVLEPRELSTLEPSLAVLGATYNEEGAFLRVPEFLHGFAKMLADMGVEIRPNTEALDVEVVGRTVRAVQTTRGDFQPAELVVAAGAWSPALAGLNLGLLVEPVKGHAVTVTGPVPRRPITLGAGDGVLAITPMSDGFRIAGGRTHSGFDTTVSQPQVESMLQAVREYLPDFGPLTTVEVWTGLRPSTPDGVPVVGRAEGYENVSIACGHGHIGMGLAPAGGRLLAERVLRGRAM